jgi:hypothetical protein
LKDLAKEREKIKEEITEINSMSLTKLSYQASKSTIKGALLPE